MFLKIPTSNKSTFRKNCKLFKISVITLFVSFLTLWSHRFSTFMLTLRIFGIIVSLTRASILPTNKSIFRLSILGRPTCAKFMRV